MATGASRLPTARRWLPAAAGAVAVALVWLISPGGQLPLYDGIGFPDEPYRFVDPPAGYRATSPPATARAVVAVANDRTAGTTFGSAEQGPQVQLYLPSGALDAAHGPVTAVAQPVAPPSPPAGHLWSNVYRVTFTAAASPVTMTSHGTGGAQIALRTLNAKQPGPKLEVREPSGWRRLKTYRNGNDVYAGPLVGPGDYALVSDQPLDLAGPTDNSSEAAISVVGVAAAGLGVVIAIVVFVRLERAAGRRRREARSRTFTEA